MSQLNSWYGGLANLTFSQRIDRKEYVLKNILASKPTVKDMFCRVLDNDAADMMKALEKETSPKNFVTDNLSAQDLQTLQQAYNRLCTDKQIYTWMWDIEGWRKKSFRIQWLYDHIFAAVPYTTASRIVLDSERDKVVDKLIREQGFMNLDQDQQNRFESDHFYYGYNIEIEKEYDSYWVDILFETKHKFKIFIYVEDAQEREKLFDFFNKRDYEPEYSNEYIWLYEGNYNLLQDTYNSIMEEVNDLSARMEEYKNDIS